MIEHKITISKDRRFLIHRTIDIHIMPTDYYRAMLANAIRCDEEELTSQEISEIIRAERMAKDEAKRKKVEE